MKVFTNYKIVDGKLILPEGLTVGGSLNLSGTNITTLPEGLTVCGCIWRSNNRIDYIYYTFLKKYLKYNKKIKGYIYADYRLNIFTEEIAMSNYTYYKCINGLNLLTDGIIYAHCKDIKEGIADLRFKKQSNRGAEQYKALTLDSVVSFEDAVTMYRIITGACQAGTQDFIDNQKELKTNYTIQEIIDITNGQYGAKTFKEFFLDEK